MNGARTEHVCRLIDKIVVGIEETDCTYQEAMLALDSIKENYTKKGSDLLNSVSIQKIAAFGGLLS